jgi:tetratricopeptide (TPR) repeat protein
VQPLLDEARAAYPDNCMLLFWEGRELISKGAFDEAIDRFDRILDFDPATAPPDGPAYDERVLGELSHEARALALFRAGRYAEAALAYGAAEALAPENPGHAVRRRLAAARAGSSADAA